MNRRYWAELDGERIYRDSLAAIKRIAQDTADKVGRVVRVGYDERPTLTARRNPAAPAGLYVIEERDAHGVGLARPPLPLQEAERIAAQLARAHPGQRYTVKPAQYEGRGHARRLKYPAWKPNPARPAKRRRQSVGAYDARLAYLAGVVAARDGQARASNPHYGAEAKAWREGFDYVARTFKQNPDPGSYLPLWVQQEKGRKMRLDYLAATKARRLAKSLRGRDRGGAVKAGERRAEKTGKFAVKAKNAKEAFTLYRASRAAAETLGAEFEAAGYKVTIAPV